MKPGDELPIRTVRVNAAAMRIMAEVLRDPNPIHLDPAATAAAGLGDRVINQGPANLAYVIDMLAAAMPDHRLAEIESRYLANARDGDVLIAGGTVTSVTSDNTISCDFWLRTEDGQATVTGMAVIQPRQAAA